MMLRGRWALLGVAVLMLSLSGCGQKGFSSFDDWNSSARTKKKLVEIRDGGETEASEVARSCPTSVTPLECVGEFLGKKGLGVPSRTSVARFLVDVGFETTWRYRIERELDRIAVARETYARPETDALVRIGKVAELLERQGIPLAAFATSAEFEKGLQPFVVGGQLQFAQPGKPHPNPLVGGLVSSEELNNVVDALVLIAEMTSVPFDDDGGLLGSFGSIVFGTVSELKQDRPRSKGSVPDYQVWASSAKTMKKVAELKNSNELGSYVARSCQEKDLVMDCVRHYLLTKTPGELAEDPVFYGKMIGSFFVQSDFHGNYIAAKAEPLRVYKQALGPKTKDALDPVTSFSLAYENIVLEPFYLHVP